MNKQIKQAIYRTENETCPYSFKATYPEIKDDKLFKEQPITVGGKVVALQIEKEKGLWGVGKV